MENGNPTLLREVKSQEELKTILEDQSQVVLHFWAEWSEQCRHMDLVLAELATSNPGTKFVRVEAEAVGEVSEKYNISSVPLFLVFESGTIVQRIEGADPVSLTQAVEALEKSEGNEDGQGGEDVSDRIKRLLGSSPIVLFMKGTADAPRCKFSSRIIEILGELGVVFESYDILEDDEIRQGLKEYANWPTFPQLYVNGELLGGCDIIVDMYGNGELPEALGLHESVYQSPADLNIQLEELVKSSPVMVFMKGNPANPQCGFSSRVVNMLQSSNVEFGYFDILQDEHIRQGLKEYSQWPTYPQVYAHGELLGGCDILTELYEEGELKSTIMDALAE